jgi:hypothetical protein
MIIITRVPWQSITIHPPKALKKLDVSEDFNNASSSAKTQTFTLSDEDSKYRVESSKHLSYNQENTIYSNVSSHKSLDNILLLFDFYKIVHYVSNMAVFLDIETKL